jgi:hypothetical protein
MTLHIRVRNCYGQPMPPWDDRVWDIETGPIGLWLSGDAHVSYAGGRYRLGFRGIGHVWLETRDSVVRLADAELGLRHHEVHLPPAPAVRPADLILTRSRTFRRHLAIGINVLLARRNVGKDIRALLPSLLVPEVT